MERLSWLFEEQKSQSEKLSGCGALSGRKTGGIVILIHFLPLSMRKEYFVYILECSDKSYYVGVTNDVERRCEEHACGINRDCYTFERRPVRLVYSQSFWYINDAIRFEKVVKDWSRKKRQALIRKDFEALRLLSRKKFPLRFKRKISTAIETLQWAIWETISMRMEW